MFNRNISAISERIIGYARAGKKTLRSPLVYNCHVTTLEPADWRAGELTKTISRTKAWEGTEI